MKLEVYRNVSVIDSFNIDENTVFVQRFLGENVIQAKCVSRTTLNITLGDYVRYNGIKYYVNTIPDVVKNSTNQYVYSITLESEYYAFAKVQFRSVADEGDFYLMGDLEDFVDLLITNMNRVAGVGVWTKGTCTQTNAEFKLLKFEVKNCREVIQMLCDAFQGEFSFDRKVISFADTYEHDTGLTFQYKAGLRNIERIAVDTGNLITRLYAFGSTKNLGSAYGKLRLELNTGGVDYIESNTATYGVVENSTIFEDVYPRRTGTLSGIDGYYKFTDAAIDFNVNSYLIDGVTAKVNFKTGNCAGYTFDIASFTNATKEFEILPCQLENEAELPNATMHPEIGDTYVIIDITMPASYITTAETELLGLATTYLAKYDHPKVTYKLTPDWRYMKTHNVNLTIGDTITISDTNLGINVELRIVELSQQLLYPYKYTLVVSDQLVTEFSLTTYKVAQQVTDTVATAKTVVDINSARRNWRDSEELRGMIFDPDGYFTAHIKPLSIETISLAAGAKSGNFNLKDVQIKPNYAGSNNKLSITAGYLVHFNIDNTGANNIGTWTLIANTTYDAGGLTTGTAYYLYAKCSKTNYTDGANQIIVSSTAYQTDQDPWWYFLVGILHSTTGVVPRAISLTYGQTLINGGFIKTGKIESANGLTYFDLDNNTLVIGSASGYSNISDKPTLGSLAAKSAVGATDCDTTIITGGKIITGLLTADNIITGTLTGRLVRTDTGAAGHYKRIELDVANNRLSMYDPSNQLVCYIDDGADFANCPEIFLKGFLEQAYMYVVSTNAGGGYGVDYTQIFGGGISIRGDQSTCQIHIINAYNSGTSNAILVGSNDVSYQNAGIYGNGYIWSESEIRSATGFRLSSDAYIKAYTTVGPAYKVMTLNALNFIIQTSGTQKITIDSSGNIDTVGVYKVGTNQVVGARGAAVADATDATSVIARLNDLLARCRAHGLIST